MTYGFFETFFFGSLVGILIGFGIGGFVAYKWMMSKLESEITGMFGFDDAGALIDSIVETQESSDEVEDS